MKKHLHIEDRDMMVWLPVLAMADGIPQIGELCDKSNFFTEDEIQAFVNFCEAHNLNWCITEIM
jgi:hypothetical protein